MTKIKDFLATYLLIITFFLSFGFSNDVEAAQIYNSKVVKVGVINWEEFSNKNDGELFKKYSLEYLQKLEKVTGLNFIYNDYKLDEALKLLEEKKIDAVLGVVYTQERASKYAFISPSVFKKNIEILALNKVDKVNKIDNANKIDKVNNKFNNKEIQDLADNIYVKKTIKQEDLKSKKLVIKDKVFGLVGDYDNKYKKILEQKVSNKIKVNIKKFESNASLKEALLNEKIDYIIGASYIFPSKDLKRVATLIQDDFYLVANSSKESLINELGKGIIEIKKAENSVNKKIISKYIPKERQSLFFNVNEIELLNSLDKLTFYILKGNDLYYKIDPNGKISGLYAGYISEIANLLHKDYEVIPITLEELKKMKKPGFYFDVIRNYKSVEEVFGSKMISKPILEKQILFYENSSAIKNNSGKIYVSQYPKYMQQFIKANDKVIRAKDDKESLKFLLEKKADIAIVDYSMANYINSILKYKGLNLIGLESNIPVSILVVNTENKDYLGIINKTIDVIPKNYLRIDIAKEARNYIYKPTLSERIQSNTLFFTCLLFVVLILGFLVIKSLIDKNKKIQVLIKDTTMNNAVKDDFISRISHDMRTPLNAIINYSNFGIEENKNPKDVEYFQKIKDSSYNLLNLMKNVLDIQKMENANARTEWNIETLNIGSLFSELKAEIEPLAKKKGIDFSSGYKFDSKRLIVSEYAKVNKIAIKQVLFNILSNAIKYTDSGGKISWQVEIIEKENQIIVEHVITDTGIGISKDFQKDMYKTFSVGDTKLTNNNQGTGLGLAIAFKAIKILEGKIECKSEVGKGTIFVITFPMKILTKNEARLFKAENIKSKQEKELNKVIIQGEKEFIGKNYSNEFQKLDGLKILICEDAKINVLIIEKILTRYKIKSNSAENGLKALELVKKNKYDLILMDVKMPVLDGINTTIAIRKLGIKIPIVGLSGNSEESDVKKALDAGMNDYIEKPIDKRILLEKILEYAIYLNENENS